MLLTEHTNSVRKAAVLFRSLEPEAAAVLLAQLSPDEGRALRNAIRELSGVSDDEREAIAAELRSEPVSESSGSEDHSLVEQLANQTTDGVELAIGMVSDPAAVDVYQAASLGESEVCLASARPYQAQFADRQNSPIDRPPSALSALQDISPETLAVYLAREQPQTIAVVLSDLEPTQAAAVLDKLPSELRTTSLERLADLGEADPESLRVLAADLNDWIAKSEREQRRQESRLGKIGAILEASKAEQREVLIDQLRERGHDWVEHVEPSKTDTEAGEGEPARSDIYRPVETLPDELDIAVQTLEPSDVNESATGGSGSQKPVDNEPEAVELISPPPVKFPFAAMIELDAMELAAVMKRTPPRQLLLALAGGDEALQKRIETLLPRVQLKQLRRQLVSLGPLRLREIDEAQEQMCRIAAAIWRSRHSVAS